jgi:hypothetical protein
MKMIYIFLGFLPLKLVSMDKPDRPSAFAKVKAAAAAWPPAKKPAAAWSPAKKPAAAMPLKRSSDDEEQDSKKYPRRRHKSIDLGSTSDSFMEEVKKSVTKAAEQSLAQETKNEILEGRLKIISDNPPLCEVMVQNPWRCRYGCRQEFINKDVERQHIMDSHKVVPASADQEWGIDWEEINKMKNYIRQTTPPLPEEDQEEEEVQEIVI